MAPERARAAALQGGKASRPPLRKINLIGTLIFNRSEKKKKNRRVGKNDRNLEIEPFEGRHAP